MLKNNNFVLYKNQPAIITGLSDGKYVVEYCTSSKNGKKIEFSQQKVRDKDIISLGNLFVTKEQISSLYEKKIDTEEADKYLETLYELFSEENIENISFEELLEYSGLQSVQDCWNLFLSLQVTTLFTQISDSLTYKPRTKEEIENEKNKFLLKKAEAENRIAFLERLKTRNLLLPDDVQQMQDVEALALGGTDKSRTMKEISLRETQEKAHKLLLDTGIWTMYKNPHPARHGLSIHSATEQLGTPPEEERITLDHIAYAIDNKWSTDPDDAIAFDGKYVWIHIADPASNVMPDSSIDISARNRGSTLYIPEGAARMLAESCLEDYALGLTEISRALSFKIELDENGSMISYDVMKTFVKVKRFSYEEVEEKKNEPEFAVLYDIARKNESRRLKSGAVSITLPEVHISVENNSVSIHPINHIESENVVKEFMLMAGEAAARFAFKNEIPFPFISQEKPDIPKEIPEGLCGQYKLRKCMRSRSVGITPKQHAALGLGMYSQVTSPLRRYGDLVAHQQLRAFIDKRELLNKDQMIERIGAGDAAAMATSKAERNSRLHWVLVYLKENPDWTGEAIIVEIKGKNATCLIPSLGMETSLIISSQKTQNESIIVKAGNINIPELSVSFQEI